MINCKWVDCFLKLSLVTVGAAGFLSFGPGNHTGTPDPAHYVNTFTGTGAPGNTYPGAVVPFGMVQLSPDNGKPGWNHIAGYFWPDSTIAGFSHTHLSGTGAGDMCDLLVMPLNSRFTKSLTPQGDYRPYSLFNHEDETAHPGYYEVLLKSSGIRAELTTSERVGFHRYTFPPDTASRIILDLGYAINWDAPTQTYLHVEDSVTVSGFRKSTGWARDERVYFVMKFSRPWNKVQLDLNGKPVSGNKISGKKTRFCAFFHTTPGEQILVKVALSSASISGARKNLAAEIPGWNFDAVRRRASILWNKALSSIIIQGTDYQKKIFYTNLYHSYLTPSLLSDVDGMFKGADGKIHQARGYKRYDTFSLWDTFRAAQPLYTLICPDVVKDMIRSFLAHYDETGLLPVWSIAGNETNMMIGYHAVPVIVDAFFKGIPMDTLKAFRACIASATDRSRQIPQYMNRGYVPYSDSSHWSVSKTLEYAYDDWCIARFAKALGKKKDAAVFAKRAENWRNLYDSSSAFFRARNRSGTFVTPFNPNVYGKEYCESNAWQYAWFVPQNISALIDTMGRTRFIARLDSMFSYTPQQNDTLPVFSTGMIGQYVQGNEPDHHVAYLYNMVGQSWKTQKLVRTLITRFYSKGPNGYCGNEDCGQMSAWLVFSALGMYPVNPASGLYSLTSPWIKEARIKLPGGKTFSIKTRNQGPRNVYIKNVFLNGKELTKPQISHRQILKGGVLLYILDAKPNKTLFKD